MVSLAHNPEIHILSLFQNGDRLVFVFAYILIIMAEMAVATSLEEKRRWLIINASPRGQCSK